MEVRNFELRVEPYELDLSLRWEVRRVGKWKMANGKCFCFIYVSRNIRVRNIRERKVKKERKKKRRKQTQNEQNVEMT
ncbi:hypothetical protein Scep_016161 [Stephania cephalantha]|uniref:Uncharacterized protein n=1 Tax=Stephania cephalantha TaxID=152367 RepID=A0AAP0INA0_9MAGN